MRVLSRMGSEIGLFVFSALGFSSHKLSNLATSLFSSPLIGFMQRSVFALLAVGAVVSLSTTAWANEEDAVASQPSILNINTADVESIASSLSGIGAVRAQAIVDYRLKHGNFLHIDELQDVPGIGEVTFERIKSQLTVKSDSLKESPDGAETAQLAAPSN